MTAPVSSGPREVTLLHVVHVQVWKGRDHVCRVAGCPGFGGVAPADRLDVWGPDGAPGPGVDVTMQRVLREHPR